MCICTGLCIRLYSLVIRYSYQIVKCLISQIELDVSTFKSTIPLFVQQSYELHYYIPYPIKSLIFLTCYINVSCRPMIFDTILLIHNSPAPYWAPKYMKNQEKLFSNIHDPAFYENICRYYALQREQRKKSNLYHVTNKLYFS